MARRDDFDDGDDRPIRRRRHRRREDEDGDDRPIRRRTQVGSRRWFAFGPGWVFGALGVLLLAACAWGVVVESRKSADHQEAERCARSLTARMPRFFDSGEASVRRLTASLTAMRRLPQYNFCVSETGDFAATAGSKSFLDSLAENGIEDRLVLNATIENSDAITLYRWLPLTPSRTSKSRRGYEDLAESLLASEAAVRNSKQYDGRPGIRPILVRD